VRFANHALLGEVRLWGGDLGMPFLTGNLRDARRALLALREPGAAPAGESAARRDRLVDPLLGRLELLLADAPRRAAAMARCGGPETLLHGDLWLANLVGLRRESGTGIGLIDWDHAAVGPPLYDVSTFLYRFPRRERRAIWALYVRALGAQAWCLPDEAELALLCETAEHGRIANRVIWPALAARSGADERAWLELEQVGGWFDALEPLFP
jgi:aminoglycoside phosphotransferase (APT) family kinase protein